MLNRKKKFFLSKKINNGVFFIKTALILLKKYSIFRFDESVDLSLFLSNDFKKNNKIIKGTLNFPYNYKKFYKILIFVDGYLEYFFRIHGFFKIGFFCFKKNFFEKYNIEYIITTPLFYNYIDIFSKILFLKKIKIIVVNKFEIKDFIFNFNSLNYNFKSDKYGVINLSIGKISYDLNFLEKNFFYFIDFLRKEKKKIMNEKNMLSKIYISSTMGVSFKIFINNFLF